MIKKILLTSVLLLPACSSMPDMNAGKRAADQKDYKVAYDNYAPLAEFGIPKAKMELGKLYLYGRGVEPDAQKALVLFEEAKTLGDTKSAPLYIAKAQTKLGAQSLKSKPGAIDPKQGVELLNLAASSGEGQAYYELAQAFEKGKFVRQNVPLAERYYILAAENGFAKTRK